MKQIPFTILLLLLSILKCVSENKIQTEVIPIETFQTRIDAGTNCASVISNNFVIAVEEIKNEQLKDLFKNDIFIKENVNYNLLRLPELLFFIISVENKGDIPLNIGEIKLYYNNTSSNPLIAEELKNKYNFLPYSMINFDELLSIFKLDADELCDNNIDFTRDIVKYNDPILSGDKVFQIIAFDWIPVEIRKFNLSIVIKSDIIKKIIDFKLMRFEYRRSGEHFIKPDKDDNNY